MMRNQKGITLIALVITIIVLLILAGVSIAMLTGENGILTQATESKTATNKAEAVEKINLALNAAKTEIYKQQADDPSWEPATKADGATAYTMQAAIGTILGKDGVTEKEDTGASGVYEYSFDTSTAVLTISYFNTTTEVGTADAPINGTLDLSAAPYSLTAAK